MAMAANPLSARYAGLLLDEFKVARERSEKFGGTAAHWLERSMPIQMLRAYCEALAQVLEVPAFKARTKRELAAWAVEHLSRRARSEFREDGST